MPTSILDRVREAGRVTFRDFMELALYDPDAGYYGAGRVRFGASGDFVTSAETHPIFGELLADWVAARWSDLGCPTGFAVVEVGPGSGVLAADLAAELGPDFRLVLVERSPALRERQRERLERDGATAEWLALEDLAAAPVTGVVISNELVDALPVHRARAGGGRVREMYVAADGGRLVEVWDEPSRPEVREYVERYAPHLLERDAPVEIEVGLEAVDWMARVAACVESGFVLTIDYGDTADRLFTPSRPHGTLRGFRGRQFVENPLAEPGSSDLTASVNFSALVDAGDAAGLEAVELMTQSRFLRNLGIVARAATRAGQRDALALKELLLPGGIGDAMTVLVQRKRSSTMSPLWHDA